MDSPSNPADDITRHKKLGDLGPQSRCYPLPWFLRAPPDQRPETPSATHLNSEELTKAMLCFLITTDAKPTATDCKSYTSLAHLLEELVKAGCLPVGSPPTATDYQEAETQLLQQVQKDYFAPEITQMKSGKPLPLGSRLLTLAPKFDSAMQLILVGGWLCHSSHLER